MSYTLSAAVAAIVLDAWGATVNGGTIKVYAGAVPANADAALGSAVLLGTLGLSATAFQNASGHAQAANAITQDASADATGDATFFREFKADGSIAGQGSVGETGSGADLELNTVHIVAGGPIQVTGYTRGI